MAVNHLVAFSDVVTGLGIIGGSPYGCGTLPDCGNTCSGFQAAAHLENKSIPWDTWVDGLRSGYIAKRAKQGQVAPLSNLRGKPVFLFSGLDDVYVYQSVMRAVQRQFRALGSRVHSEFSIYAAHSWVVDNATCASPGVAGREPRRECCGIKGLVGSCAASLSGYHSAGCCGRCSAGDMDKRAHTRVPKTPGWRPPINSCDYDLSGEILRWVEGADKVRPRGIVRPANLLAVNQSRFLPPGWTVDKALLDETGFVYVPSGCQVHAPGSAGAGGGPAPLFARRCSVHVHYHPCGGSLRQVGLSYMLENALPAYAESNDMVVLYPQSGSVRNPSGAGCFDWYGAVGQDFDTRAGVQLNAVLTMMRELRAPEAARQAAVTPAH